MPGSPLKFLRPIHPGADGPSQWIPMVTALNSHPRPANEKPIKPLYPEAGTIQFEFGLSSPPWMAYIFVLEIRSMRKWIIVASLLVIAFGAAILRNAAKPVINGWDHSMIVNDASEGDAASYRQLCQFTNERWRFRQWFQDHDFIVLTGCILADQAHTKVSEVRVGQSGESTVTWNAKIGITEPDGKVTNPRLIISIKYDLAKGTATLLNTGESHPLLSDKVYMVYVTEQFKVDRFVVLDPDAKLTNVHHKVSEMYSFHMLNRHGIAEQ